MNKRKNLIKRSIFSSAISLAVLALILLGLFLPEIAFSYQNRQAQKTVNQEEVEPITFTWSSGLMDTMQLFAQASDGYNMIMTVTDYRNYSDLEILSIITDYVQILCDYHLMAGTDVQPIEESFDCSLYYVVLDTDSAAVDNESVWSDSNVLNPDNGFIYSDAYTDSELSYSDAYSGNFLSAKVYLGSVILTNGMEFYFYIDDQTGKVASFYYYPTASETLYYNTMSEAHVAISPSDENENLSDEPETESASLLEEDYDYYIEQLTALFEDYYGYTIAGYDWRETYDMFAYGYWFEVSDTNTGQLLAVPILIYDEMVYFNRL